MTQAELDAIAYCLDNEAREAAHSDPRTDDDTTPDEFMRIYCEHFGIRAVDAEIERIRMLSETLARECDDGGITPGDNDEASEYDDYHGSRYT